MSAKKKKKEKEDRKDKDSKRKREKERKKEKKGNECHAVRKCDETFASANRKWLPVRSIFLSVRQ